MPLDDTIISRMNNSIIYNDISSLLFDDNLSISYVEIK